MKKKSVFPNRTGARTTALRQKGDLKRFNRVFHRYYSFADGYVTVIDSGLVRKEPV